MSTPSEKSDTDSSSTSWILVDDGEKDEVNEAREAIEEIHDWDESDGVSIISEPEDLNCESSPETTLKPEPNEEVKEEPRRPEHKEELIAHPKNEVVPVPRKFNFSNSSITSFAFMVIGLTLALYFHNGYEDEVVSDNTHKYTPINSKELLHEPMLYQDKNADIEYIEAYNDRNNERKFMCGRECGIKNSKPVKSGYDKQDYKGKQGKYDRKSKHDESNYEKQPYDYKRKENKNKLTENDNYVNGKNIKSKYYKTKDSLTHNRKDGSSESHEGYLMKKENFLRHKENKLKQKEIKINARYKSEKYNSNEKTSKQFKKSEKKYSKNSGIFKNGKFHENNSTWYFKMHKGRSSKRKDQQSSDWWFDRAKARRKNKGGWYFSWMEDRENIQFKKDFP